MPTINNQPLLSENEILLFNSTKNYLNAITDDVLNNILTKDVQRKFTKISNQIYTTEKYIENNMSLSEVTSLEDKRIPRSEITVESHVRNTKDFSKYIYVPLMVGHTANEIYSAVFHDITIEPTTNIANKLFKHLLKQYFNITKFKTFASVSSVKMAVTSLKGKSKRDEVVEQLLQMEGIHNLIKFKFFKHINFVDEVGIFFSFSDEFSQILLSKDITIEWRLLCIEHNTRLYDLDVQYHVRFGKPINDKNKKRYFKKYAIDRTVSYHNQKEHKTTAFCKVLDHNKNSCCIKEYTQNTPDLLNLINCIDPHFNIDSLFKN